MRISGVAVTVLSSTFHLVCVALRSLNNSSGGWTSTQILSHCLWCILHQRKKERKVILVDRNPQCGLELLVNLVKKLCKSETFVLYEVYGGIRICVTADFRLAAVGAVTI